MTSEQKEGKGCDRARATVFILLVILVGYAIYSEQARKELEDSLQIQVEQLRKELQEELVKMSAERIEEAS
jgi:uncharacterized protein YneF (UPF0154 family)